MKVTASKGACGDAVVKGVTRRSTAERAQWRMGNRSSLMKRNEMRLNGPGFRLPMGETAARTRFHLTRSPVKMLAGARRTHTSLLVPGVVKERMKLDG